MKYKIWNGTETLVTPKGEVFTAAQVVKRYPMAGLHGYEFIILNSPIQLGVFMELQQTKKVYKSMFIKMASTSEMTGQEIERLNEEFEDMTTSEFLEVLEFFEDNQPEPDATSEERIASALEFQNLLALPDVEV